MCTSLRRDRAAGEVMRFSAIVNPLVLAGLWAVLFSSPVAALGVCADPDYLPYSNRAGAGFENKIAEAVAKALGETVQYTWASHSSCRPHSMPRNATPS